MKTGELYRHERNEAIIAMALDGVPPGVIEGRLGISRNVIYATLRAARQAGRDIPIFTTSGQLPGPYVHEERPKRGARPATHRGSGLHVVIPHDALFRLRSPAIARGMTSKELARDIITRVVDDDLVDAVLDDGDTL